MVSVERVKLAYNNVYFVEEGDTLVVIDTGPDYRGAREALTAALRGRTPALVVATHGHLDHAGLGKWWQEQGVPVLLGEADLPQASGAGDGDIDLLEQYVRSVGAPPDIEAEVVAGLEMRREWTRRMRESGIWPEARDGRWPTALRYESFHAERTMGSELLLPIWGLKVDSMPGHTPGNVVVVFRPNGNEGLAEMLFSGDQLLPEITPTPAIQFKGGERFPSLPRFRESLEALDGGGEVCYPGHGEPFDNVGEVLTANLEQIQQRSERVYDELRLAGPSTVYALSERMYPRALRRRFWQIIATVQGHLDVFAEAGAVSLTGDLWSA